MAMPKAPTIKSSSSRQNQLQDKIYNMLSFSTTSMQEKLSPNYFAMVDENQGDVMMPYLQEMKNNHRKCPYWMLLKHYCPCTVDTAIQRKKKTFSKPSQRVLLADHSTVGRVHSFLCSVLKRLIPLELFGNITNRGMFFKNIQGLLCVQKHGEISLDYLIREIKVSKMLWLLHCSRTEQRERLLRCIDFLVSQVVCPLIQSFFVSIPYIGLSIFMFRKRVWHRLRHKAFYDFTKFCKLNVITQHKAHDMMAQKKCLGFARINFILKKNGLRPISNLSFRENGNASINNHLTSLLVVLNYEKDRNNQSFGVTAMGKSDFHQKFQKYIMRIRQDTFKRLYFVTADVEKCFDCIEPSLLFKISLSLLKSDFYVVHKYKLLLSGQRQTCRYFESVQKLKDVQHRYGNVEFIGQRTVSKKHLVKKLEALLLGNVIKMGNNYYIQKKGISQGSKISSLLSAAYLSHLESEINTTKGFHDFLVRVEDEYLFGSTMESSAHIFLRHLIVNMPKFECNINVNKCAASFDCDLGPGIGKISKSSNIKFYGLSINATNFCVSSDYSGYKGLRASHVVTCRLTRNIGRTLRKSVIGSLYPKCDTILFDDNINTENVMKRNVLQIFCMSATKFHFLVMRLPKQNRVDKNPSFFLEIIQSLPALVHEHINHSLSRTIPMKGKNATSPLSIETIRGLCFKAFLFKLMKNRNIYNKIINELKTQASPHTVFSKRNVIEAFNGIFLR